MATRLHTYALIKTLFDQNRDYFDTFVTLVLQVISEDSFVDLPTIQSSLLSKLEINIPLHVLKTICTRAQNKGYIEQQTNHKSYKLTLNGIDSIKKLEAVSDVDRRISALVYSAIEFFKSKNIIWDERKVHELLYSFIEGNIDGLIDFLSPKVQTENISRSISKNDSAIFLEFLFEIKDHKPFEYNQFQELVFGSILSSLLTVESSSEISDINSKKFNDNTIFFDTNIIFSLLGLHSKEINSAANELVTILKKAGFKLMIFDFTLNEVCRVVNGYLRYKNIYPSTFHVDSVYSHLKIMGWGYSDVVDFISTVEDILWQQSIGIFNTNIVDLSNYKSSQSDSLKASISANKNNDFRGLSTNHDLAAIDLIRDIRKSSVRKMEDAKAFFITSDFALQRTVLYGLEHHENGTLSEVMLDRVMANILWLKDPQIDLPLGMIIAAHSRDLLVDRKVWDKFYSILEKLRRDGTLPDNKIDTLFYQNNIESFLRDFGPKDLDKINEQLVIDEAEKAAEVALVDKKNALLEHSVVKDQLFEAQSEKDKEEQAHNLKIIDIRSSLRRKAEKDSVRKSWVYSSIAIAILLSTEFYFFLSWYPSLIELLPNKYSEVLSGPYGGLGISLAALSVAGILWLRGKIAPNMIEKYFHSLLRELALEQE